MHFFHCCTSFFMPSEKNVFGWAVSHACTASFSSWSEVNRWPLNASLSEPNGDSLKGRDQDYMEGEPIPQTWVSGGFQLCGQQYADWCCHATTQCLWQLSLAFASNFRLQPVNKHLTVMSAVYCWIPLLLMFQYWALWVPKNCKH